MNVAKLIKSQTGPLAQAGMVSSWGQSSAIVQVQTGIITLGAGTSTTATINSVITNNCVLLYSVSTQAGNVSDGRNTWARLTLTNTTTLTLTINADAGFFTTVRFTVFEFAPGVVKSNQQVSITVAASTTNTVSTISQVTLAKSFVNYLGCTNDTVGGAGLDPNATWFRVFFDSATGVQALRNTATANVCIVNAQVVEFF